MRKILLGVVGAWVLTFAAGANAGVVYSIQNGKLAGASGISINGELYSVSFGDSCASMYAGCQSSLFDFTTSQDAVAALDALFNQVFLDNVFVGGIEYDFDSKPELVKSCDRVGFCEIWVPYADAGGGNVRSAWQVNVTGADYLASTNYVGAYTYGDGRDYMAFTNFEKVSASVPEPASLALLGLGLAGLGLRRQKKTV